MPPLYNYHAQVAGCPDCEFERLRNWAIQEGLIDRFVGPTEMTSRIIRLFDAMQRRIHTKDARVEELTRELAVIKSGSDPNHVSAKTHRPVDQLQEGQK
jgi:hypothetical protein